MKSEANAFNGNHVIKMEKSCIKLVSTLNADDNASMDDAFDSVISETAEKSEETDNFEENDRFDGNCDARGTSRYFQKQKKLKCFVEDIEFEEKSIEEKLEALFDEFKKDTDIRLDNMRDIACNEAYIKGRWCSRLMAERVHGKRLTQMLESLKEEIGKMYDTKSSNSSYLQARMGRDNVINNDKRVKMLKTKIAESKQVQDYLQMIYDSIKTLGLSVKNSIDTLKLERGI